MNGAHGVAALVAAALTDRLPAATGRLRDALGLQSDDLPDVVSVVAHEPDRVGVEEWPMAVVTVLGDGDWKPLALEPGTVRRRWLVDYRVRVMMWARGDGYAVTTRAQRLLHQAAVEALLTDLDLADGVRLDDASLASSLSEVTETDAGRTIAGARLDVTVRVEETLPAAAVPVVAEVTPADTTLLPR